VRHKCRVYQEESTASPHRYALKKYFYQVTVSTIFFHIISNWSSLRAAEDCSEHPSTIGRVAEDMGL
jgi:hypothetical protein